jgi:hypothetical protein
VSPDASIGWKPVGRSGPDAVVPEPGAQFHRGAPNVRPD